jgi:pyruvate dehydrogenase E1 component
MTSSAGCIACARPQLLGSGAILLEVLAAADLLRDDWRIDADVWSVTSFSELARDAQTVERLNMLHPDEPARTSHVERSLADVEITVVATDYVRAYPRLIAPFVPGDFVALGTDGFGRSDTRSALRGFFGVDRYAIVLAVLHRLVKRGARPAADALAAIARYELDAGSRPAWER